MVNTPSIAKKPVKSFSAYKESKGKDWKLKVKKFGDEKKKKLKVSWFM